MRKRKAKKFQSSYSTIKWGFEPLLSKEKKSGFRYKTRQQAFHGSKLGLHVPLSTLQP
jgi:hypothetical protein